jgi:membrane protease YdiL (CAAX protease family)
MQTTPAPENDRGLADDILFIVVAYAFLWLLFLLPFAEHSRLTLGIGTFGPTVAALVVGAKQGGRDRVIALLRKFLTFRAPIGAYLLAWYLVPTCLLTSFIAFGFAPAKGTMSDVVEGIVLAAPLNYTVGLISFATVGPQGEELGWRGYLLPRWQRRFGEAIAPAAIGVVWSLWHLPFFFMPNWGTPELPLALNVGVYTASAIAFSYLFAAVYWIGRESLIVVIVLHAVLNLSNIMLGATEGTLSNDNLTRTYALLVAGIAAAVVSQGLWFVIRRRRAVVR